MMDRKLSWLALAALLPLGACVSAEAEDRPKPAAQPPKPVSYTTVGLENVIGRNARFLETQFGKPELDVREGTARKLQFAAPACVLDAYLYPRAAGSEPIVTHVDARLPDGRDIDRASCVAALIAARLER
jgi:hypothetical protein